MNTRIPPADQPSKVHFVEPDELIHPAFRQPAGSVVTVVPLRDLTLRECEAFGLSPILKGNADLMPAGRVGEAA